MIRGVTKREDGFVFGGYYSNNDVRINRRGKPQWYSPKAWERERKRHADRHKRIRAWITARLDRFKVFKGCSHCGYKDNPAALQFHHVDPSKKLQNVSMIRRSSYSQWKVIKAEIRKCIVLCANCHSIETKESYKND
tara:strand:- start:37 stop:447 length:411 start_codon:yes stop_codon:yes gene_type:complete